MQIPLLVWETVASYCDCNLLDYLKFSEISGPAYTVFTSDHIWRSVTPYDVDHNLYQSFLGRIRDLPPEERRTLQKLWRDVPLDHDITVSESSNLDICLPALISGDCSNVLFEPALHHRAFVRAAVLQNDQVFEYASEFHNDFEIALSAVKKSAANISFVSPSLRRDDRLVEIVVQTHPETFFDIYNLNNTCTNIGIAMSVFTNPETPYLKDFSFSYLAEPLLDNLELALALVSYDRTAFGHLSWRLQDNRTVAIRAANAPGDGQVLAHASRRLRDDDEVVRVCVTQRGEELQYASERLRRNEEVIKLAANSSLKAFLFVEPAVLANQELVNSALANTLMKLQNYNQWERPFPPELCEDRTFMLHALAFDGDILRWATPEIKDDALMVTTALRSSWKVIRFASERLKDDEGVVQAAYDRDKRTLRYVSDRMRNKFGYDE